MPIDPALKTNLLERTIMPFTAVEILLPANTIRLLDAATQVVFPDGRVFTGKDAIFGILHSIGPIEEGLADSAPRLSVDIYPRDEQALALLAAPSAQGSTVNIYTGTIIGPNGTIPTPEHIFLGRFQKPERTIGKGIGLVSLDVASWWEKLFEEDEGFKLNNTFNQEVHPGSRGMEFIVDVQRPEPWGADVQRPAVVRDVTTQPSPYTGGGGGAGGGGGLVGGGGGGGGGDYGRYVSA